MQGRRKGGLRRVAIVLAVATAGVLTVGAHAAFAQGTLEICKSSANGMSGREFQFSVNGGSPITVKGGRCTGPFSSPAGSVTITEAATSPPTDVDSITVRPSQRNLGLVGRTATVNVPEGSTAANETRVTFVNVAGGGPTGDLKICKLTETPAFYGRLYTFHVNGGPGISTEANPAFDDPSTWSCRLAGTFAQGTIVTVKEDIPAGQEIAFIDSDPPDRLVDFDTNTGVAHYLIGSGVTVALYDNEPLPPTGTGFIEVCKDAALLDRYTPDPTVLGEPFDFTIDEPDQSSQDITVLGGQCSQPIPVAAGVVRVTEHANPGFQLVNVFTIPNDRLLDSNLINRTADVEVPASDNPNDETQVHFVNEHERAQLKICKALGPGSADLIGRPFTFVVIDISDPDNPVDVTPKNGITVIAAGSTQCVIVGDFPVGTVLRVRENPTFQYVTTSCAPVPTTIGPGINTVTCTNTAQGKLEICKFVSDPLLYPGQGGTLTNRVFYFRIDGGPKIGVRPGLCSPPQLVSVGRHTVTEENDPDFELTAINVSPPEAQVGLPNLLGRSVTVDVPWAGDPRFEIGREVRVDFTNRIRRGQIKVCKHITDGSIDSLGGKKFSFNVYVNGVQVGPLEDVAVEECRLVTMNGVPRDFPILQSNGNPTTVAVEERNTPAQFGGAGAPTDTSPPPFGTYYISRLALQGGRGGYDDNCVPATYSPTGLHCKHEVGANPARHVLWNLGPNTNTIHFTNTAGDP